jgi:hypothetical protein
MKARSFLLSLLWVVLFSLGMAACKKDTKPPVDQTVTITSFTPTQGEEGTIVTLIGKNFEADKTKNVVRFNGIAAEVVEVKSATEMTVKVPADATSGKVSVVVNNQTATSTTDFAIVPTVKLTSFSPQEEMEGVIITLSGKNFDPVKTNNTVTFNGVAAEVTDATTTELKVRVPIGTTTGKISVTVGNTVVNSITDFTVTSSVFSATKLNQFVPCKVKFANSITGSSYKWRNETKAVDLSTDKEPQITFMEPGTQTISFTVMRADGVEVKKTLSVTIDKDVSLVAYYPMGTLKDSSGNGKDALATTPALVSGTGRTGIANSAYYFTGSPFESGGLEFRMPDNLIKGTGSATTVSFWFQANIAGVIKPGVILGYQDFEGNPSEFVPLVYIGSDRLLRAKFWSGANPITDASGTFRNQLWNHLVITGDASGQALYLNGNFIGDSGDKINHLNMLKNSFGKGYIGSSWPSNPLGAGVDGVSYFKGYIDDVRIYNKRLSPEDVRKVYEDKW